MTKNSRVLLSLLMVLSVFGSQFLSAQSLRKAMKYYEKAEYASAIPVLNTLCVQEPTNAAPFYLLAKIYSEPKYQAYDYFKAFESVQRAFELFPTMPTLEQDKIVDYANWEQISASRKQIEVALYEFVKSKNDVETTKKFLSNCSTSIFIQDANELLINQEFAISEKLNTSESYQSFLKNYPATKFTSLSLQRIYKLEFLATQKQNNSKAYLDFIAKYPDAPQTQDAKKFVMESDYQLTMRVKTNDAIERFIKKYPSTSEAASLRMLLEKSAYEQAMQLKSVEVFDAYLTNYPNSSRSAELANLRDSLAFELARQKNTTEAYFNFLALYPNAKQAAEVTRLSQELRFSWEELVNYRNANHIKSHAIKTARRFKTLANDSILRTLDVQSYLVNGELDKKTIFDELGTHATQNVYISNSRKIDYQLLFMNDKEVLKKRYSYTKEGLIGNEREEDKNGKAVFLTVNSFDENRNCIQKTNINEKGDTVLIANFIYLQSFTPQEKVTYQFNEASQNFSRQTFVFNGSGVLLQEITSNIENKIVSVVTYHFDSQGKMIAKDIQSQYGKELHKFVYNSFGLIEYEYINFPDMPAYDYTIVYHYEFFE